MAMAMAVAVAVASACARTSALHAQSACRNTKGDALACCLARHGPKTIVGLMQLHVNGCPATSSHTARSPSVLAKG